MGKGLEYHIWKSIWTYTGQRIDDECQDCDDADREISLDFVAQCLQREMERWGYEVKVEIKEVGGH